MFSHHMWGRWEDKHSSAGPDFFPLPFSHVHGCDHDGSPCGEAVATPTHTIGSVGQTIGFIGGSSSSKWIYP